jgi:hypothetical protein
MPASYNSGQILPCPAIPAGTLIRNRMPGDFGFWEVVQSIQNPKCGARAVPCPAEPPGAGKGFIAFCSYAPMERRLLAPLALIALLLLPGCPGEPSPQTGNASDSGEEAPLAAHCSDGIYNMGEEGLDCGWSCPSECEFKEKSGMLLWSETWSGNIHVPSFLFVPSWATLTIEPGTLIKFGYSRDYKNPGKGALHIEGTVNAKGTPESRVWFTSDAPGPINGDWRGITLQNSNGSSFDYAIVEFGEMGIEQFDSDGRVSNSIVRWCNAEGLYAERSRPVFENNTLYSNAYHEIALEQYNEAVIRGNYFHDGVCGVHSEKTVAHLSGNYFENYLWPAITAGMESELLIEGNIFVNVPHTPPYLIYGGSVAHIDGNIIGNSGNSSPAPPDFGYEDIMNFEISHMPGDENDTFPYIYDEEDETRRVLSRIGKGLGFGWALSYAEGSLYRFSLGSGEVGESLDFIRINPDTGEYEKFGNDWIMNPRGLAWDGEYFWASGGCGKGICRFTAQGELVGEIYPAAKGTWALATDGGHLWSIQRTSEMWNDPKIYEIEILDDSLGPQ